MRRTYRRHASIVTAALTLVATMAACGDDSSDSDDTADSDGPLVIGHVGGLTGALEAFDGSISVGMQIAVDEINANGGVLGRDLKLVEVDTASDTANNVTATQQVLEDGADFVMVPADFNFGAPVARFANSENKLALGFVGDANFGHEGIGPLTFNLWQGTETETAALAEWAYNVKGIKRPFLLEDSGNAYGAANCAGFRAAFEALAGADSIAGEDTFQSGDTSVGPQVASVQDSGADAVMVCSFPPGGVTPIRELRAQGVDLPILIGAGYEGNYWQDAVPGMRDVFGTAMLSIYETAENPDLKKVVDEYQSRTGEGPVTATFLAGGYMAVKLVAAGVEAAESADPEAVATGIGELGSVNLLGLDTPYEADCNVPVGRPTRIVEYTQDSGTVIDTITPENIPSPIC